jgi:hypothetical protein
MFKPKSDFGRKGSKTGKFVLAVRSETEFTAIFCYC